MPTQAHVVWDKSFMGYDFGVEHPMNPLRLDLTARLCDAFGLFDGPDIEVVNPPVPPDEILLTVHDAAYVAAVRHASVEPKDADQSRGLGTEDDPAFAGMHEISARIAAGSLAVASAVWRGETEHGVNFCGGLHHAMPGRASGFCIYNDAAVAIAWLLDNGAERVVYVDVDVHHGDGVERMFWDDPRVLTISVHESGRVLFPGTGFAGDTGGPGAPGSVANLALSVDAQRTSYESLHDLAHEHCDGKWVALGGGGYELVDVVPRAWTHLTAIAAHRPIPLD